MTTPAAIVPARGGIFGWRFDFARSEKRKGVENGWRARGEGGRRENVERLGRGPRRYCASMSCALINRGSKRRLMEAGDICAQGRPREGKESKAEPGSIESWTAEIVCRLKISYVCVCACVCIRARVTTFSTGRRLLNRRGVSRERFRTDERTRKEKKYTYIHIETGSRWKNARWCAHGAIVRGWSEVTNVKRLRVPIWRDQKSFARSQIHGWDRSSVVAQKKTVNHWERVLRWRV